MKCTKLTKLLSAVSFLLVASTASANVMTYDDLGLSSPVMLHAAGLLADGKTLRAGQYHFTYEGVPYYAFCVDIDHYAGTSQVTEEAITFLRNGEKVAYLYETFMPEIETGIDAAALAVSLWEVIYEEDQNDFDAGDGYLYITNNPAVLAAANDMLADVPDSYQPVTSLTVLDSECKQDMLIGSLGKIPEPATLALLALASPFALMRRRTAVRARA
jgi:hypothetical protein